MRRTLVTAPRFVLLRLFLQVYLREIPSFTARVSPFSAACAPFSGLFEHVPGRISHQTERFSPQITLVLALFDSLLLLEFSLLLFRVSPFSRSLAKKRWTRLSPRERTSVSKG